MYDLELDSIIEKIRTAGYKRILIQLPDGLKPRAEEIVDALSKEGCTVEIWFSSCFGACDLPANINDYDLFLPFGHVMFYREEW
ncbi:hypothetical protein KY334_05135 [Candidatus Woesearchaeota archaeon]|nr:hypothetical protein [Candidatus Woesearchaeota archaeon]